MHSNDLIYRGVAFSGEWDWFPEKYLRLVMDINFFGHVAVTKAFLGISPLLPSSSSPPLLSARLFDSDFLLLCTGQIKKTKGRIINLTSVAGFYTEQRLGAYSCSKVLAHSSLPLFFF